MELIDKIKAVAEFEDLNYLGVADVTPTQENVVMQGGDSIARFPRAVSIGITLVHVSIDRLSDPANAQVARQYRCDCYERINERLDIIAPKISRIIQRAGFSALPIAASQTTNPKHLCSVFSHKMAAHLAGLGWIGKSCLLITPEAGPRVRWATVLTDAPLSPTGKPMPTRCGNCEICVKACPAHAFTGRSFDSTENRQARYDAFACDQYLHKSKTQIGLRVCGLCVKVCPYGLKRSQHISLQQ